MAVPSLTSRAGTVPDPASNVSFVPNMPERVRTVLNALIEVARPIILTEFTPTSCIGSTRIGVDVLAYFGITGKPVPVSVMILNAEAVQVLAETGSMDAVHDAALETPADVAGGAWTIGVGAPGESRVLGQNDWPGHLVIGLKPYSVLVDLSLDQAARPLKNIAARTSWYSVSDGWWAPTSEEPAVMEGSDGTHMVVYRTDNNGYRVSPNWKPVTREQRALLRDLTARVIAAVKDRGVV